MLTAVAVLPLLLATRLPATAATAGWTWALAGLVATTAALASFRPAWRWLAPVGVVACLALVSIPRSPSGWELSPVIGGGAGALLVLQFYANAVAGAPRQGSAGGVWLARILRWLPIVGIFLFFLALQPLLGALLPDDLAHSYEVQGPPGVLLAGLIVGLVLASASWVRAIVGRQEVPA